MPKLKKSKGLIAARSRTRRGAINKDAAQKRQKQPPPPPPAKRTRINWALSPHKEKLTAAVDDWFNKTGNAIDSNTGKPIESLSAFSKVVGISVTTLQKYTHKDPNKRQKIGISAGRPNLLDDESQIYVANMLAGRDGGGGGTNNVPECREVHNTMQQLLPGISMKQAMQFFKRTLKRKHADIFNNLNSSRTDTTAAEQGTTTNNNATKTTTREQRQLSQRASLRENNNVYTDDDDDIDNFLNNAIAREMQQQQHGGGGSNHHTEELPLEWNQFENNNNQNAVPVGATQNRDTNHNNNFARGTTNHADADAENALVRVATNALEELAKTLENRSASQKSNQSPSLEISREDRKAFASALKRVAAAMSKTSSSSSSSL